MEIKQTDYCVPNIWHITAVVGACQHDLNVYASLSYLWAFPAANVTMFVRQQPSPQTNRSHHPGLSTFAKYLDLIL